MKTIKSINEITEVIFFDDFTIYHRVIIFENEMIHKWKQINNFLNFNREITDKEEYEMLEKAYKKYMENYLYEVCEKI